jgi:hypothetical protein
LTNERTSETENEWIDNIQLEEYKGKGMKNINKEEHKSHMVQVNVDWTYIGAKEKGHK